MSGKSTHEAVEDAIDRAKSDSMRKWEDAQRLSGEQIAAEIAAHKKRYPELYKVKP